MVGAFESSTGVIAIASDTRASPRLEKNAVLVECGCSIIVMHCRYREVVIMETLTVHEGILLFSEES